MAIYAIKSVQMRFETAKVIQGLKRRERNQTVRDVSGAAAVSKETELSGAFLRDHFRCTFTLTSTLPQRGIR